MKLKDKVAVITGAASGIGKATAVLFAKEGAKVVIADVDFNNGKEVENLISKNKGDATFISTDVTDSKQVKRLFERTIKKYGKLDILFNNAGIYLLSTVDKMEEKDWDAVIDVNLKGPFLCSKFAIPLLKKNGGVILNTASTLGLVVEAETPAYCASKAALIHLSKAMAIAYAKDNIRINTICPGPIDTPLLRKSYSSEELEEYKKGTAMNRIGKPEEVARVALFLASDEASYVTGGVYTVDGGEALM